MTASILRLAARVAEMHPFSWWLAWTAVHHMPFLLPHDKSYNALRHFIAARPEGLFLDIGANDGISVLSFRKFSPAYKILSLEPNALLEPPLRKIRQKDANFDYRMVGAGSKRERIQFYVPVYKGIVLHTFTSASRDHTLDGIAESFGESVRSQTRLQAVESDVILVDDLDISPTIVKIDAEGFNLEVLRGARKTLARSRPFVMTELELSEWDDLSRFFAEIDYDLVSYGIGNDTFEKIVNPTSSRVSGERNIFAIPRDALAQIPIAS
jgi:FkbM family methyltransferase